MKPSSWLVLSSEDRRFTLPDEIRQGDPEAAVDCGWVEQMRPFVRGYSKPEDLVLDPFAGWGTTAVATVLEGRRAVACELEPERIVSIKERLANLSKMLGGCELSCELLQADSRDLPLPDASVDLVLTNVPYFGHWQHKGWAGSAKEQLYRTASYDEYLGLMDGVIKSIYRVMKASSYVVVMAENLQIPGVGFVPLAWDIARLLGRYFRMCDERIILYNREGASLGETFDSEGLSNRAHEYALVGRKI